MGSGVPVTKEKGKMKEEKEGLSAEVCSMNVKQQANIWHLLHVCLCIWIYGNGMVHMEKTVHLPTSILF